MALLAAGATPLAAQWTITSLAPGGANVSGFFVGNADVQGGWVTSSGDHATIWFGTAGSAVDLHPASGATGSYVQALSSTQQGGFTTSGVLVTQAALWSGTAASLINLNPSGYEKSSITAMTETQEGGYATLTGSSTRYAGLWSGTAGSFVNLHPGGIYTLGSYITAMSSTQEGGIGLISTGRRRALLWTGTSTTVNDLNNGYTESGIYAMTETAQGGFVNILGGDAHNHAALWYGTGASLVDLHPAGATKSEVRAMAGDYQAGFVDNHAAFWAGSAATYVDLHSYVVSLLGSSYDSSSVYGAYLDDDILYLFGTAGDTTHSLIQPVIWTMAIPEPSTYALAAGLLTLGVAAVRRRQRAC